MSKDLLKYSKESKVTSEFDSDEKVELSCDIKKVNDYGKTQGRQICITNKRFYNLDKKKIKRAIKIADITAMTKNNVQKHLEFIVHVSSESDYRFKIDKLFRENGVTIPFPQRDVHLFQQQQPSA